MCILPTDFLRTHFRTSSKSPQEFAARPYLSENQCTILNYIAYRKCRFVGLKPSKPTKPTLYAYYLLLFKEYAENSNYQQIILSLLYAPQYEYSARRVNIAALSPTTK